MTLSTTRGEAKRKSKSFHDDGTTHENAYLAKYEEINKSSEEANFRKVVFYEILESV